MKKTKKIRKLTLKNLKVSVLESREAPLGGGWCSARAAPTCTGTGVGALMGLDAPPEFQALTGGVQQPGKICNTDAPVNFGSSCMN